MVLKGILAIGLGLACLAWSGAARADEYRPDEFLKLDLPQAVLSPKLLGPPTQFEPVPVEAKAEPATKVAKVHTTRAAPLRTARAEKPAHTAKPHIRMATRLAHRHGNPLDAEAMDTRIQVWPCRSGGICNWKR
jgi:hypothetical protein